MTKFVGFLAGAALIAILGGIAYLTGIIQIASAKCTDHNNHCIVVSIDGANKVSVDVPDLRKKGKNHVIWWYIDNDTGQDFRFRDNGIVFLDNEGKSVFSCVKKDKYLFKCDDPSGKQHSGTTGYKYTVTVESGTLAPYLDPFVWND